MESKKQPPALGLASAAFTRSIADHDEIAEELRKQKHVGGEGIHYFETRVAAANGRTAAAKGLVAVEMFKVSVGVDPKQLEA